MKYQVVVTLDDDIIEGIPQEMTAEEVTKAETFLGNIYNGLTSTLTVKTEEATYFLRLDDIKYIALVKNEETDPDA